jgi:hypothetical protein
MTISNAAAGGKVPQPRRTCAHCVIQSSVSTKCGAMTGKWTSESVLECEEVMDLTRSPAKAIAKNNRIGSQEQRERYLPSWVIRPVLDYNQYGDPRFSRDRAEQAPRAADTRRPAWNSSRRMVEARAYDCGNHSPRSAINLAPKPDPTSPEANRPCRAG